MSEPGAYSPDQTRNLPLGRTSPARRVMGLVLRGIVNFLLLGVLGGMIAAMWLPGYIQPNDPPQRQHWRGESRQRGWSRPGPRPSPAKTDSDLTRSGPAKPP